MAYRANRTLPVILNAKEIFDPNILINIGRHESIANKNTIEYIYTKPNWTIKLTSFLKRFFSYFTSQQNPYGHSVIGYNNRQGSKIMNVSGNGDDLINFFERESYFLSENVPGNPQGGLYVRSFLTLRINNVSDDTIRILDQAYKKYNEQYRNGKSFFSLITYIFTNPFTYFFNKSTGGNCAFWTSKGLVEAKLLKKHTNWPLVLFFRLLIDQIRKNPNNFNVIYYASLQHYIEPQGALLQPFWWFFNSYKSIWNLNDLADIHVIPEKNEATGNVTLIVKENPKAKEQWEKIKNMPQILNI
jgi:hypothetical protein